MTSYSVISYSYVMQAVILAAGLGTRMRPLTNTVVKPLLKIGEKPLLRYSFDALPNAVDEVIMVVGYLKEQIKMYLGNEFDGKRIQYVEQKNLEGTAKALFEARRLLKGRFLVLMADDIYKKKDIEKCLQYNRAMLVKKSEVAGPGGKVILDESGHLKEVIEDKNLPVGTLNCLNVFVLDENFFDYAPVKLTNREGEWGLPQTVVQMAKDFPIKVIEATRWIKITIPEDLKMAEKILYPKK